MDSARKRGRPDSAANGAAGAKRHKELETGIGSKLKPCNKFFSTAGCPFGEGCHFAHFVQGGVKSAAHMLNLGDPISAPPSRKHMFPPGVPDGPSTPTAKTRICKKYNTAEGCKFGDQCHFAHGESELSRRVVPSRDSFVPSPMAGRFGGRYEQPQPAGLAAAASFGASATAKISVDASLAGAIIGKGGINTKHIVNVTGAKLSIRDHESDPKLRNIELEGTFDQIKQASTLVKELIVNISASTPMPPSHSFSAPPPSHSFSAPPSRGGMGNNIKTKLCENFAKGSCTFGDRCHFAHGESELRKPGV